jgi:hypothetical protein
MDIGGNGGVLDSWILIADTSFTIPNIFFINRENLIEMMGVFVEETHGRSPASILNRAHIGIIVLVCGRVDTFHKNQNI